jgi:hypothetical protein
MHGDSNSFNIIVMLPQRVKAAADIDGQLSRQSN